MSGKPGPALCSSRPSGPHRWIAGAGLRCSPGGSGFWVVVASARGELGMAPLRPGLIRNLFFCGDFASALPREEGPAGFCKVL